MAPSDPTTVHERRLAQLERLGFTSRTPDGKWVVPHDLLDKLDAKDKAEPRSRLVVDRYPLSLRKQVGHLGPVWLDGVRVETLAPFGFGADLGRALSEREQMLRQNNIDPSNPHRYRLLRSIEETALARQIAQDTGGTYVEEIARSFRGTVVRIHESPGGGVPYAEVRDSSRFVLVAANRDLHSSVGRSVTLSYDAKGRLQVRVTERDRGDS